MDKRQIAEMDQAATYGATVNVICKELGTASMDSRYTWPLLLSFWDQADVLRQSQHVARLFLEKAHRTKTQHPPHRHAKKVCGFPNATNQTSNRRSYSVHSTSCQPALRQIGEASLTVLTRVGDFAIVTLIRHTGDSNTIFSHSSLDGRCYDGPMFAAHTQKRYIYMFLMPLSCSPLGLCDSSYQFPRITKSSPPLASFYKVHFLRSFISTTTQLSTRFLLSDISLT